MGSYLLPSNPMPQKWVGDLTFKVLQQLYQGIGKMDEQLRARSDRLQLHTNLHRKKMV